MAGFMNLAENGLDKNYFKDFQIPADDPFKSTYIELLERTEAQYTDIRLNPGRYQNPTISDDRRERLSILGERITTMRRQDTQQWIAKLMTDGVQSNDETKRKPPLLPNVIVDRRQSDILEHPDYNRVNLRETWQQVYRPPLPNHQAILDWSKESNPDRAQGKLFSYVR